MHYTDDATGDSAGSGSKYRASNNIIFDVLNERKAGAVLQVDDTAEGTTKRVIVKDIPMRKELTKDELINRDWTVDDLGKKMTFIYTGLQPDITLDITGHIEASNISTGISIRFTSDIKHDNGKFFVMKTLQLNVKKKISAIFTGTHLSFSVSSGTIGTVNVGDNGDVQLIDAYKIFIYE